MLLSFVRGESQAGFGVYCFRQFKVTIRPFIAQLVIALYGGSFAGAAEYLLQPCSVARLYFLFDHISFCCEGLHSASYAVYCDCPISSRHLIPIAFSKSLSCRQLCLGIITMHYLEQMSRRPQLPEGFNDVDF
ncbi:hypothetical protein, partial [Endozoicomonas atrinae]|uniref:hypothetical protein n=1 Tax=Endozoicomonas atrinae TaxID=1333660 RepID=UPI001EE77B3C